MEGNAAIKSGPLSVEKRFLRRRKPRADEKANAFGILERKHAATSGDDIKDKLRVFPIFKLSTAHVEGRAVEGAKEYIAVANKAFAAWVTHGRTSITTTT